jgi:hypothetical protein
MKLATTTTTCPSSNPTRACARREYTSGDKLGSKRTTVDAASAENAGACDHSTGVQHTLATKPAEIWTLSFTAAVPGEPPMPIRICRLLKAALRAFGLRCVDFSTSAGPADDGRAMPVGLRGVAGACAANQPAHQAKDASRSGFAGACAAGATVEVMR